MDQPNLPALNRPATAAWFLLGSHRLVWNLAFWPVMVVVIGTLMLRSTAENPEVNLVQSKAALVALQPASVPDEENAAVLYRNAFKNLPRFKADTDYSKDPEGQNIRLKTEVLRDADAQAVIQASRPVLQMIRAAARMERCNWGVDYSKSASAPLDHLSKASRAARLLLLEAADFASRGEHQAAAENIETVTRMALHLKGDKFLIMNLSSLVLRNQNMAAVQIIVFMYCPERPEEVVAYRKAFKTETDFWNEELAVLQGERAQAQHGLDGLGAKRLAINTSKLFSFSPLKLPSMPWYGSDRKTLCALFDDIGEKINARKWKFILESDETLLARVQTGPVQYAPLIVGAINRTFQSSMSSAQLEQVMDVSLAALQYRLKHGRDITKLDDLVPEFLSELPRDFFNPEQTILMRRDDHGYLFGRPDKPTIHIHQPGLIRFYSTGQNGVDDDGYTQEGATLLPPDKFIRSKYPTADDITFAIPPLKPKEKEAVHP